MNTKKDYRRALAIVRAHIVTWDPYALIHGGAPDTEFDGESALIVKEIPHVWCARDLVMIVSAVFCDAFGYDSFPPAQCEGVAKGIYDELANEGLLATTEGEEADKRADKRERSN